MNYLNRLDNFNNYIGVYLLIFENNSWGILSLRTRYTYN